ncbi:hypothetical protein ACR79K_27210 [Sphingobacterium siyangense]|uniref:hypothetical protein n=1 Tax=Sphingobacterium siyangense TaxID=459529 RepID=UPI003DA3D73A
MDKLTLEHLAPYLPYGVEVKTKDGIFKIVGWVNDIGICLDTIFYGANAIPEYKLILRPLSDLTKEIEHNGEMFVPKEVLIDRYDLKFDEGDYFFLDYYCIGDTDSPWTGYHIIQLLIQWHFDVFGLIDKGLAIDINSIEGKDTKS